MGLLWCKTQRGITVLQVVDSIGHEILNQTWSKTSSITREQKYMCKSYKYIKLICINMSVGSIDDMKNTLLLIVS